MSHGSTERKVSLAISDIKSNSLPGIDGISPKFMKMAKLYNQLRAERIFSR